jgi:hypothetical protein
MKLHWEIVTRFCGDHYSRMKVNLERLMMEHNRGWQFLCLIAHDTFGSFMKAQFVVQR